MTGKEKLEAIRAEIERLKDMAKSMCSGCIHWKYYYNAR